MNIPLPYPGGKMIVVPALFTVDYLNCDAYPLIMRTTRNRTQIRTRTPRYSAWKIAEKHGVDMSLLQINLHKTALERIMRHEQVRHLFMALGAAGRRLNVR